MRSQTIVLNLSLSMYVAAENRNQRMWTAAIFKKWQHNVCDVLEQYYSKQQLANRNVFGVLSAIRR